MSTNTLMHSFYQEAAVGGFSDVDCAGESNPTLDEFRLIQGDRWPVESESVEICLADWVMEHVADPALFLSECHRVLKPDGHVCLSTLNRHSCVGIAARPIPNRLHARVLKYAQDGRETAYIFPTLYRGNTRRALRTALAKSSLQATVYAIESEPSYRSARRQSTCAGCSINDTPPHRFAQHFWRLAKERLIQIR